MACSSVAEVSSCAISSSLSASSELTEELVEIIQQVVRDVPSWSVGAFLFFLLAEVGGGGSGVRETLSAVPILPHALATSSAALAASCWARASLASADAILSWMGRALAFSLRRSAICNMSCSATACSPAFHADRRIASKFLMRSP